MGKNRTFTIPQSVESMYQLKKVELTVVGIRNYCSGGEDGLPALFERLPVGSTLYLRKNPTGTRYPGAVSVLDGIGTMIGNISKTYRRFIELAIPQDGMLPCKVIGHSKEHHCMYIEAENNVGFKEPYIRNTTAEEGELIFSTTEEDERLLSLTQLMLTRVKEDNSDPKQLLELANEYAKICCTSLDGETTFARAEILLYLKGLNEGSGIFDEVISLIFEKEKDLGRAPDDVKTIVYRDQYNRIRNSAYENKAGKTSQIESYIKGLAFTHGGKVTKDIIRAEVNKLSQQLANEFMGTYVKASETDEDFANALYSLNYSLRAIYIMYTRRIKREHLLRMLEDVEQMVDAEDVDRGMKGEESEDPIVMQLIPIFYNDKAEIGKFLSRIKGVKPTEITATVTRLVKEGKVSALSCKGDMWKIMYDAGLYQNEKNTWNKQVII